MGRQAKKPSNLELLQGNRQVGESDSAVVACNDYLRLGQGRSFSRLLAKYADIDRFGQEKPPTLSITTLKDWSAKFTWQARANEYDATFEERKTKEREEAFNYALALDYERLDKLQRLAYFLETQIYAQAQDGIFHNIWLSDVKSIGSGDNAERVDIERFNAPLIEQYRKTLDDLAKETGGRQRRVDMTSGGKRIGLTADQLAAIDQQADDELEAFAKSFSGNGSHE
jgi:hypothetical protein